VVYDKDRPIGEGNFGTVYAGNFRRTTKVAVKKLKMKKDATDDKTWFEFLHEEEIMKRLNHPSLVQLYAIVNDPSEGNFLVQEYLMEGDLLQYLRKVWYGFVIHKKMFLSTMPIFFIQVYKGKS
jgi:fyn-related kinase